MIYLKNTTEIQTIFIPRNELQKEAYITSTKTYEDGYREGLEDGKEYQKDQLLNLYVTENGQYEREDGWGVVTVDVPTEEGGSCNLGEGSILLDTTMAGTYEMYASDDGYDGWSKFIVTLENGGAIKIHKASELLDTFNSGGHIDYGTYYYVGGQITEIQEVSTQYGNATYTLDNGFSIWRGKWFDGNRFDSEDQIKVGAYIVVYGVIADYNGTLQFNAGSRVIAYQECEGGDSPEPIPPQDGWGMVGYFNAWGGTPDIPFEENGEWEGRPYKVIRGFSAVQGEFKIRLNNAWDNSYTANFYNEPQFAKLRKGDWNMPIEDGVWDIYLFFGDDGEPNEMLILYADTDLYSLQYEYTLNVTTNILNAIIYIENPYSGMVDQYFGGSATVPMKYGNTYTIMTWMEGYENITEQLTCYSNEDRNYVLTKIEGGDLNIDAVSTSLGVGTGWTRTAAQYGLDGISQITIDGRGNNYWQKASEIFQLTQYQNPRGYNGYALGVEKYVWVINGYVADIDTDVEIWVKPEEYNRNWGGYFGSQSKDDAPDSFQIRKNDFNNGFLFQFGTEVYAYDFNPNTWYRLRMNRYGVWVNGEQKHSWDIQEYTPNGFPLTINGINNPEWANMTDLFRSNRAEYGYIYFHNLGVLVVPYNNGTFIGNGLNGQIYGSSGDAQMWQSQYYEGFGEGGECNIQEYKWVRPSWSDRAENGDIYIYPDEGFDAVGYIDLDPSNIYNEGVEAGRAEVQDEVLQYDTVAFTYKVDGWFNHNLNKDNITNDCDERPLDCLLLRNRYGECTVMTKLDNCSGTVRLESGWNGDSIIYSLESNTITKFSSSSINSSLLKSIDTGLAQLEESAIINCNALTDIKVAILNDDLSSQFATNCFNGLPTEGTITIGKNVEVTLTDDEITSFFRTIVGEGWTITIE